MMRPEFVQRLILNSMCDDFENVDQVILRNVAGVAAKCGLTVERPEVVENLRALVEAGLAKAYDLFPGIKDHSQANFRECHRSMFRKRTSERISTLPREACSSTKPTARGGRSMIMMCFVPTGSRHETKGNPRSFRYPHKSGQSLPDLL
jgi:hypothetical protein